MVDMEYCPPVPSNGPQFPPKAAKAKEAAQNVPNAQNTLEYHEIMEGDYYCQKSENGSINYSVIVVDPLKLLCIFLTEEMIRGLQQLGWRKVDVSFHAAFWPFFAHNNIHVLHPPNLSVMDDDIILT